MGILCWTDSKIKKMTWVHIGLIELCVASFSFLIAKVFPKVLDLSWYWYAGIGGISYIYLMVFMFLRK